MKKSYIIAIAATMFTMFANNVSAQKRYCGNSDKGTTCFYESDGYIRSNGDTVKDRHYCGGLYAVLKYESISEKRSSNNGWSENGKPKSGFQVGIGYRAVRNTIPVAASVEITAGMLQDRTIDGLSTGNSFRAEATAMLETSHLADLLAGRHHDDYHTDWLILGAGLRYSVTNTVYGGVQNPNRVNMRQLDFVARGSVTLFSFGKFNRYNTRIKHAVKGFVEVAVPVMSGSAQDWWSGNEAQYAGQQNKVDYTYKATTLSAGFNVQL